MNNSGDLDFPAIDENSFALNDQANIWDAINKQGTGGLTKPIVVNIAGVILPLNPPAAPQIDFHWNFFNTILPAGRKYKVKVLLIQFTHISELAPVSVLPMFYFLPITGPAIFSGLGTSPNVPAPNQVTQFCINSNNLVNEEIIIPTFGFTVTNLTSAVTDSIIDTPMPITAAPVLTVVPFSLFVENGRGSFQDPQNAIMTIEVTEIQNV